MIDPIQHKEVNDLIDNDIEYRKELEYQRSAYDKEKRWHEEKCDICGHQIHPLCNNANCYEPHPDPMGGIDADDNFK